MRHQETSFNFLLFRHSKFSVAFSSSSKEKVRHLIAETEKLSKFEKLLFYLELPSSNTGSDPLRQ